MNPETTHAAGEEMNMTICPRCKAENRPEAAFCSRCGMILFAQPSVKPFADEPTPEAAPASEETPTEPTAAKPAEQPAFVPAIPRNMEGAIFGERFQYDALIYQDEHETHFTVTELNKPGEPYVRICSNKSCRTIHVPLEAGQEQFCTYCGSPLDENIPLLLLQEADSDRYSSLLAIVDLHLAHPNIHPPVATFQQEVPGGVRYYLVRPYSQELPVHPDVRNVLDWGIQLAGGLDYLHMHGMAFGATLDPAAFGLAEEKIVWRDFSEVRILPMLTDREKINNVRQLALSLYAWMTGKSSYSFDPALSREVNDLFQCALVGEGFTSGASLAQEIEQVSKAGISPLNIDYQVGRRTHAGQMRLKNEDSVLCLTLSRIINGASHPAGIYAIADGMGGHATGELASSLTIQAISQKTCAEFVKLQHKDSKEYISWLVEAVQAANMSVYQSRQTAGNDMGSTLVCALFTGSQAYIAYLGDSRSYLIREGNIQQLTTDHSLVQHLVSTGQLDSEVARYHPQRNVIYRSLGDKPQVEVDICTQNLLPGDKLLLCSDGCTGMLEDQNLQKIILDAGTPQAACDRLVEAANQAGGEDNISVILVEVVPA